MGSNVSDLDTLGLDTIRNKNEARVAELLPEALAAIDDYEPSRLEIQDIYALTLNLLPPRYAQRYSFVIHEPVTDGDIRQALGEAVAKVRAHPKRDDY